MTARALGRLGITLIGSYFGPIGGAIGAFIGGQLLPPYLGDRSGDVGRIDDLEQNNQSSYGKPIPLAYGSYRLPVNVTWAPKKLIEKAVTSRTGNEDGLFGTDIFSSESHTYRTDFTYFASFSCLISKGVAKKIKKIWANQILIWSESGLDEEGNPVDFPNLVKFSETATADDIGQNSGFQFFRGTDSQMPSAIIENYGRYEDEIATPLGAGRVSAQRGYCYVVFNRLPLANDLNNRRPSVQVEVEYESKSRIIDVTNIEIAEGTPGIENDYRLIGRDYDTGTTYAFSESSGYIKIFNTANPGEREVQSTQSLQVGSARIEAPIIFTANNSKQIPFLDSSGQMLEASDDYDVASSLQLQLESGALAPVRNNSNNNSTARLPYILFQTVSGNTVSIKIAPITSVNLNRANPDTPERERTTNTGLLSRSRPKNIFGDVTVLKTYDLRQETKAVSLVPSGLVSSVDAMSVLALKQNQASTDKGFIIGPQLYEQRQVEEDNDSGSGGGGNTPFRNDRDPNDPGGGFNRDPFGSSGPDETDGPTGQGEEDGPTGQSDGPTGQEDGVTGQADGPTGQADGPTGQQGSHPTDPGDQGDGLRGPSPDVDLPTHGGGDRDLDRGNEQPEFITVALPRTKTPLTVTGEVFGASGDWKDGFIIGTYSDTPVPVPGRQGVTAHLQIYVNNRVEWLGGLTNFRNLKGPYVNLNPKESRRNFPEVYVFYDEPTVGNKKMVRMNHVGAEPHFIVVEETPSSAYSATNTTGMLGNNLQIHLTNIDRGFFGYLTKGYENDTPPWTTLATLIDVDNFGPLSKKLDAVNMERYDDSDGTTGKLINTNLNILTQAWDSNDRSVTYMQSAGNPLANKPIKIYLDKAPLPGKDLLADIVRDISDRAGVDTNDELDVSGIQTKRRTNGRRIPLVVKGFAVTNQSSFKSILETLMDAFLFVCVETSGKVKFTHLTNIEKTANLSYKDMVDEEIVTESRTPEFDLPSQVSVKYINHEFSYQTGTEYSKRIINPDPTSSSRSQSSASFSIVMDPNDAADLSEEMLANAWNSRMSYKFKTPQNFLFLDSGDVVDIALKSGVNIRCRIIKNDFGADNSLDFEAIREDEFSHDSSKAIESKRILAPLPLSRRTQPFLLNVPLLNDSEVDISSVESKVYFGLSGFTKNWNGGILYRKLNDGTDKYTQVGFSSKPTPWGIITNSLADVSDNPFGIDRESSLEIQMTIGELKSATEADFANDRSRAIVNNEVISYRDVEKTGENTYRVSHLMRGLRGTERLIAGHSNGEFFIPIDETGLNSFNLTSENLNVETQYRAVRLNESFDNEPDFSFIAQGNDLKPYAPVNPVATQITGQNAITLSWTRRNRGESELDLNTNPVDLSNSEIAEKYDINIVNNLNRSFGVQTDIEGAQYVFPNTRITSRSFIPAATAANQTIDDSGILRFALNKTLFGPLTVFQQYGRLWINFDFIRDFYPVEIKYFASDLLAQPVPLFELLRKDTLTAPAPFTHETVTYVESNLPSSTNPRVFVYIIVDNTNGATSYIAYRFANYIKSTDRINFDVWQKNDIVGRGHTGRFRNVPIQQIDP